MATDSYRTVVKRVHPHAWRWQVLGAVLALAASLAAGVWWGMHIAAPASVTLDDQSALQDRVIQLQLQTEADQQTVKQLRDDLGQQATDIADLEDLLSLYRSVVAPEETDTAAILRPPDLRRTAEPGVWQLTLVVHRGIEADALFRGNLALKIVGQGEFQPDIRLVGEVDSQKTSGVFPLVFRYLRQVQVVISLPEGFVPEAIESVVTLTSPEKHTIRRADRWQELMEPSSAS